MSELSFKYGKGTISFSTDRLGRFEVLENERASGQSAEEVIREALENPIGSPRLSQLARPEDRVCIVISDITRYYHRMDLFLPFIIEELAAAGVEDEQITILSATGAHEAQSDEEKALLLGEKLAGRFTVIDHDCRDEANMVSLGMSRNGTPLIINRLAVECDKLILTGAITEHDMAGYGGGRKSVLPGVAAYESVAANHLQVFSPEFGGGLRPECRIRRLEGNPMHQDMCDACDICQPAFLFNVILDSHGNYYKAVAGGWRQAFDAGTKYFDEACAIPIGERADVIIAGCGGFPKDSNLYQASKGIAVGIEAVKPGGTIIFAAKCEDGMGADPSVSIIMDFDNNEDRERDQRKAFVPEAYSGYYICEMAAKYRLVLVSDYANGEEIRRSGMELYRTMEEAIEAVYGASAKEGCEAAAMPGTRSEMLTYIIPSAMAVVPALKQE